MQVFHSAIESPLGTLTFYSTEEAIIYISSDSDLGRYFEDFKKHLPEFELKPGKGIPLLEEAKRQVTAYFDGEGQGFDLPIKFMMGSPLQRAVWQALKEIPYGETIDYSSLAQRSGYPRAIRAVASAVGKNPLLIVLPCHRVIRKDGQIGDYRGGTSMKEQLINLERR